MKRLIGIMAVVVLLASPAMAALEQEVGVAITVDPYCEVQDPADLAFSVAGPYYPGANYGDIEEFRVRTNAACTLTATVPETSLATAAPGVPAVDYYPTATGIDGIAGEKIGFGLALTNITTAQYGAWNLLNNPAGLAEVNFAPTQGNPNDPPINTRITVNTYMDSARGGRAMALPGVYQTIITLTIALD